MSIVSDKPLWTVKECGQFLGVGKHSVKDLLDQKGINPCHEKFSGRGTCYMYSRMDLLNAFAMNSQPVAASNPLVAGKYYGPLQGQKFIKPDPHIGKSKVGYCWLTFEQNQQLREVLHARDMNMGDWITEAVLEKLQANRIS